MIKTNNLCLSIITVCLNSEKTIKDTLESVKIQTYPFIEHIIIDGVSTDNTLAIVEQYGDSVSLVVSEKDKGIYDAMNKGLSRSTGDVLYFLNSDDCLHDEGVIADVMNKFNSPTAPELVYGNVFYKYADRQEQRRFDRINRRTLIYADLCHQGTFARKTLFEKFGDFDIRYRIAADYDWLLKVFCSGSSVLYLNRDISVFDAEGEHSRDPVFARKERLKVKLKYQNKIHYILGNTLFRAIRKLRKIAGK